MPKAAASRLVLEPYSEKTVIEATRSALAEVQGKVSIGFVFASSHYQPYLADFLELVQLHAHAPILIGSSASGFIGTDVEAEQGVGFSLLLLHLPETEIHVCRLEAHQVETLESPKQWHRITKVAPDQVDTWLAFADPFGFPVEPWLASWNEAYPCIPCIGGLSSSSNGSPEEMFLFWNRTVIPPGGALLIGLKGNLRVHSLLSQGCRPIGEPLTITGVNGNLLTTTGGKPAYTSLSEAFDTLTEEEKAHAQGNLFAGLASSEYIDEFKRGDFLIRTILGANAASGNVALGGYPRIGQTLQWQLRDHRSANYDLKDRLQAAQNAAIQPFASLLFSCNGRGSDLFGKPGHDAHNLAQTFGKLPSAGMFCNGEIGPVGHTNFIHGYTVSMALFE
jgi:small ligand-binding sensory domain FIST